MSFPSYVVPSANKRIPNLPNNVYFKDTTIPKGPLNEKETAEFIKSYELSRAHNKKAIETAIKSHKKLQAIHNK